MSATTKSPKVMEVASMFRGTEPSLWDFWRDGVSPSFVSLWQDCHEQCRMKYVQGWNGRGISEALEFGTVSHYVLEHITPAQATSDSLTRHIQDIVADYEQEWLDNTPDVTEGEIMRQNNVYRKVEAVVPSYFKRWDGDYNGSKYTYGAPRAVPVKWLEREKQFKVPYVFPDGKQTWLCGKRDGVFLTKTGDLAVRDLKTRSVIDEMETEDTMAFDFQFMSYLYSVRQDTGKSPKWMVQDIIRKPQIRQKKSETLVEFYQRLAEEAANEEKWDYKDEDQKQVGYFVRFEMKLLSRELDEWVKSTLDPTMMALRMWWEGTAPHYPTHKHLVTKYGPSEMYWPIARNDFKGHYKRRKVFPELD